MAVHVSIHDVSPAFAPQVELALDFCKQARVKPGLLVVPNFHGQYPLAEYPEFCEYLRFLEASGHEIFLHGYFHSVRKNKSSGKASPEAWLYERVISNAEAEFYNLTPATAAERLDAGLRVLRTVGLNPVGFIAPAWAKPDFLLKLLRERALPYTEDHLHIYDSEQNRSQKSLVLNFASRSPSRLLSTVAYCRLARPARAFLPTRIALHPADMNYELLRRETQDLLAWGAGDYVERARDLFS